MIYRVHNLWWLCVVFLLPACSSLPIEQPVSVRDSDHTGGQVVDFSPDGRWLASGGWEGNVQIWRTPDGESIRSWRAHAGTVNGIVFDADSESLVSAGFDGRLARWTLDGKLLAEANASSPVTHLTGQTENNLLIAGHQDGSVSLWSLAGFKRLAQRTIHDGAVKSVAISADGRSYASSSTDGSVVIWDGKDGVSVLPAPATDIHTLAFAPDGQALIGGSWFKLYRWSLPDNALEILSTDHLGIIRSIEFLPDSPLLATISRQTDSSVLFLDPESGDTIRRFQRHDLCGADITLSQDGRFLATTSDDATVRLWNLTK